MTYEYPEGEAERMARELLQRSGYRVDKPSCPDCHGMGYVLQSDWGQIGSGPTAIGWGSQTNKPCPRGCAAPFLYLSSMSVA